MKRFFRLLFSRMMVVGLSLFLQLAVVAFAVSQFSHYFFYFYLILFGVSLLVVFYILNSRINPAYKLAWIVPILLFPVFGGLFYLALGMGYTSRKFHSKLQFIGQRTQEMLPPNRDLLHCIQQQSADAACQASYLERYAHFPYYKNTTSEYLSPGEAFFIRLKEELEKAEHYIFLEFFIIEGGTMWGDILDILRRKASQGVDVRLIYDDVGCLNTLPYQYNKTMERMGIRCRVFNPFRPVISRSLNNRDHRKIVVIDGHTAFTGGINLADEYINGYPKYGHWKDTGILLRGEAVWSFTVMFLTMWNLLTSAEDDYLQYRPHTYHQSAFADDGYYIPYCDSPVDSETVGEQCYLNMIGRAKRFLYITTPYLILDNETLTAMCLAAKSGVDVRVITPGIADKWYVHTATRSYYPLLLENGVKIYEYTPGFIHSKTMLADGEMGVIGTINLDYRSLYLHFECAVWIYHSRTLEDMKKDFLLTQNQSHEITLEQCHQEHWYKRTLQMIMRVFSPLM